MPNESHLRKLLRQYSRVQVRDEGGAPEGIAEHPDDLMVNASLHILCKDIADLLVKTFPGFAWAVAPNEKGGVIDVYCLNFSNEYVYTIRTLEIQDDPKRSLAIKAGRELLRRFHYPSTRFDIATANNVPRLPNGNAVPDLSDFPPSRMKDQAAAQLAIIEGRATYVTIEGETFLHVTERK